MPGTLQAALEKLEGLGINLPDGRMRLESCGDSPELERELLELIQSGIKTASAGLAWVYESEGTGLPCPGDIEIVVNSLGEPKLVTQIDSVQVVPFAEVTSAHAALEGEGDRSLEYWRELHWQFFSRECARIGRVPSPQMPVVCTTFRMLHVVAASITGVPVS